jgi:carbonic anhydrase
MELDRSRFLTGAAAALSLTAARPSRILAGPADPDHAAVGTAATALAKLRAGNERFACGPMTHPPYQVPYGGGQAPFASLIVCADSRVGPEVVFDHGLDQLFVCRVAGNIATAEIVGSIEYAVDHFHTPLVVVLGHTSCGACEATVKALDAGVLPPASIASVVTAILPAARNVPKTTDPTARLARVIAENARLNAANLQMSPVIKGAAVVIYGVHDLASGWVAFRGEPAHGACPARKAG